MVIVIGIQKSSLSNVYCRLLLNCVRRQAVIERFAYTPLQHNFNCESSVLQIIDGPKQHTRYQFFRFSNSFSLVILV